MSDSFYTAEQLAQLQEGYYSVNPAYERLLGEYLSLALANEAAYEFVRHGFVRRLGTLKRCIENVYSVYLPERCDKPARNECLDLAINLQSFIFNVFGLKTTGIVEVALFAAPTEGPLATITA